MYVSLLQVTRGFGRPYVKESSGKIYIIDSMNSQLRFPHSDKEKRTSCYSLTIFWNKQILDKFTNTKPDSFSGNNKETFSPVDEKSWNATVQRLDSVLTALEVAVQNADEKKLAGWYSTIAHVGTHNAYHTGQIIYIRKMKGWWDDNNGVK